MGIAHHSNYYVWFELARSEYMRQQGLSYNQIENRGIMMPLRETQCRHFQGALYDDMIIIRATMGKFSGARIVMEYEVIREEDNCLLARGKTVNAITDEKLKPVNIKKKDPRLYEMLQSCVNQH